jgi:hypothetical protein
MGDKEYMSKLSRMVFIAAMLVACATVPDHKEELDSWIGRTVGELISVWGPATKELPQGSGGNVLEYSKSEQLAYGGGIVTKVQTGYADHGLSAMDANAGSMLPSSNAHSADQMAHTVDPKLVTWICTTRFTVDPSGTITAWSQTGNDCTATPPRYRATVPAVNSKLPVN